MSILDTEPEDNVGEQLDRTQVDMIAHNALLKMTISSESMSESDAIDSVMAELGDTVDPALKEKALEKLKEKLASAR